MVGRTLTGFIRLRIWIKKDCDNVGLWRFPQRAGNL